LNACPTRWLATKKHRACLARTNRHQGDVSAQPPRRARTILRYAFSLGILVWIGWQVDWREFGGLRGLDWKRALPAVLLAGLAYPLQAWRWQKLLATQGIRPSVGWVHAVFWVGNFYNSFLPGGIAGDGVRLHYTWREAPDRKAGAAASIIADRLLGFAALLVLAVAALGLQLGFNGGQAELQSVFALSALALVGLLLLTVFLTQPRWWTPLASRWLGSDRTAALGHAFVTIRAQRGALFAVITLSVAVWLLDFAALWLLAGSVGLSVGVLAMTVAAAAAYVVATLPISIGGHGVREGTLVVVLGWLGVGAAQPGLVLLLAAAFWAVTTGWSLFGGLAMFRLPAAPKIESAATSHSA
jgi:uncharacterized membrane protein YbhN (UPF0104 family)